MAELHLGHVAISRGGIDISRGGFDIHLPFGHESTMGGMNNGKQAPETKEVTSSPTTTVVSTPSIVTQTQITESASPLLTGAPDIPSPSSSTTAPQTEAGVPPSLKTSTVPNPVTTSLTRHSSPSLISPSTSISSATSTIFSPTTPTPASTDNDVRRSDIPTIVGATIGAALLLFLLLAAFMIFRFKRQRTRPSVDVEKPVQRRWPLGRRNPNDSWSESWAKSLTVDIHSNDIDSISDGSASRRWESSIVVTDDFSTRYPRDAGDSRTRAQVTIEERLFDLQVQMLALNDRLRVHRMVSESESQLGLSSLNSVSSEDIERELQEVREMVEQLKQEVARGADGVSGGL